MKSIDRIGDILNRMAVDLAIKDEPMFEAEKRAKAKLHSLLISKLPEKKPTNSAFEERRLSTPESVQNSAYNYAISDMYSTINELYGVQK